MTNPLLNTGAFALIAIALFTTSRSNFPSPGSGPSPTTPASSKQYLPVSAHTNQMAAILLPGDKKELALQVMQEQGMQIPTKANGQPFPHGCVLYKGYWGKQKAPEGFQCIFAYAKDVENLQTLLAQKGVKTESEYLRRFSGPDHPTKSK
jgi:hypothetical protein